MAMVEPTATVTAVTRMVMATGIIMDTATDTAPSTSLTTETAADPEFSELQRRLSRAGYYRGSIDGVLGPQTRRAIRAYEQDHDNVG